MKHVVPLGYVVGCDIRKVNGRLGFRITVESQYPLSIVHKVTNGLLGLLKIFKLAVRLRTSGASKNRDYWSILSPASKLKN